MYTVLLTITDAHAWTFELSSTVLEVVIYDPPPRPRLPERRLVSRMRKLFEESVVGWVALVGEA